LLSNFSSTELIVAIERNDLGAFASPIPFAPLNPIPIRSCDSFAASDKVLVSGEKIGVNAITAQRRLNPSRSKRF
jgi:hypothetical protein